MNCQQEWPLYTGFKGLQGRFRKGQLEGRCRIAGQMATPSSIFPFSFEAQFKGNNIIDHQHKLAYSINNLQFVGLMAGDFRVEGEYRSSTEYFVGRWKGHGEREGRVVFGNGDAYEGGIVHGQFQGPGRYIYRGGDTLQGNFSKGHCNGTMTIGGQIITGKFKLY